KAAVELDIFTAIAAGEDTPQALAARCGAAVRGARTLCDYLVVLGFLTKEGGRYGLTDDSAVFLSRASSAYLGGAIKFLLSPMLTDAFTDLAAVVRKGGTVISEEGSVAPQHPMWVEFARSMAPVTTLPAQALARLAALDPSRRASVLDIAAGHGKFGIAFAKEYPEAEIVAARSGAQHHETEGSRPGRGHPVFVGNELQRDRAPRLAQSGVGFAQEPFTGGLVEMMQEIRQKYDFVVIPEIRVESAACNGLVAGADPFRLRIFNSDLQNVGPVQGDNFRFRILLRESNAEFAMPRRDVQHPGAAGRIERGKPG